MTEPQDRLNELLERMLPRGPATYYGLTALGSSIVLSLWFVERGWDARGMLPAAMAGLHFVTRLWTLSVLGLLATLFLIHQEELISGPDGLAQWWLPVLAQLIYLIAALRYQSLARGIFPDPRGQSLLNVLAPKLWPRMPKPELRRAPDSFEPEELWSLGLWPLSTVCCALALLLLVNPGSDLAVRHWGLAPRHLRLLMMAWVLFGLCYVANAALRYLRWRRWTYLDARTYIASEIWRYQSRELEFISEYHRKKARRMNRRQSPGSQS